MTTRMLIDARHREETRVAVVKGHRIEEFDFESAEHKQLKGNIYLAKVTRVEPSLQAAFVEYGGNRHGFLAFSEIHPDYYQIPKEDREALLREEAEAAAADAAMRAESEIEELEGEVEDMTPPPPLDDEDDGDDTEAADDIIDVTVSEDGEDEEGDAAEQSEDAGDNEVTGDDGENQGQSRRAPGRRGRGRGRGNGRGRDSGERVGTDEAADFRRSLHRRYKIQDVIRRRQVLLVQVVKEERGNKGAALTTYLSLAGRYCVLMPNSSHGGGISRKISNGADRKRLKTIVDELGLPPSMGCIVRTAGLERTKTEIKRDFDYLARLWDEIREKTMTSSAPSLIHSDSDLIKRAIRDIYNSNIEEVVVEGDEGYRAAKDFMKLLMPSHARRVKHYAETVPLFQRYGAEDQLAAMYQPVVSLKSGGYIVINPTEALVSIDINSGRSTREHNIEQTALNTNLEAAYEIARQLRLRDMAGLVVIDFIDMEVNSHVRKVERAMRDALKNDRARIQVGRISGFGLMEMSRQRLRTGVLEASTRACPHCEGTGLVRTASSAGLTALRVLEEEAARGRGSRLVLRASHEATIYVLNHKRYELAEIEDRYGVRIEVTPDGQTEGARMSVEAHGPPPLHVPRLAPIVDEDEDDDIPEFEDDGEEEERAARDEDGNGKRRRNRRRRRGGRDRQDNGGEGEASTNEEGEDRAAEGDEANGDTETHGDAEGEDENGERRRRRRRGRRGGRGRRDADGIAQDDTASEDESAGDDVVAAAETAETTVVEAVEAPAEEAASEPAEKPKRTRTRRKKVDAETEAAPVETPAAESAEATTAEEAPAKPKRASRARKKPVEDAVVIAEAEPAEAAASEEASAKPKRTRTRKKPAADEPTVDATAAAAALPIVEAEAQAAPEPAPAVAASADAPAETGPIEDIAPGEKRRGWWQKTFGG